MEIEWPMRGIKSNLQRGFRSCTEAERRRRPAGRIRIDRFLRSDLDPTARLEWLDDLMFAAIDGDPVALDYAADAWQKTRDELGDTAVEESRSNTCGMLKRCGIRCETQPNHPPHKVFAAIEIISLLANRRIDRLSV